MKILVFFLGLFLNPFGEQPLSNWSSDFEKTKIEAIKNNKFILINFAGTDWCGPCIKLKKDIFESKEFSQYAGACLLLVRADFPRLKKNKLSKEQTARNEALAEKYNQEGKFPFTVLTDANGKVLKTWDGYPTNIHGPNDFIKELTPITGK